MGKKNKTSDDNWEFCGLKIGHVREIIDLVLDGAETDRKEIDLVTQILKPSIYNGYNGDRLVINIPIKLNSRDKEYFKHGYEIHIYDNGYFCYDNGMGVKLPYKNALEIYKIIVENFKPAQ